MNDWVETVLVCCVVALAMYLGGRLSRRSRRTAVWTCGFSLFCVTFLLAGRLFISLADWMPLSALVVGRLKFLIFAVVIPLGLLAPLPHLPRRSERLITCIILGTLVFVFAVFPFLGPAVFARTLSQLPNTTDGSGISLQSTPYTCGPAAAATVLNRLGITTTEGRLAAKAHTCPFMGTTTYDLCRAVNNAAAGYGGKALFCRPASLDELAGRPALLLLKESLLATHCVAAIDIGPEMVTFADPSEGLIILPKDAFERLWTGQAIVIEPAG